MVLKLKAVNIPCWLVIITMALVSCGENASSFKGLPVSAGTECEQPMSLKEGYVISNLSCRDSILVALTMQEPFYHIYNINVNKLVRSFGRLGRASGECLIAPSDLTIRNGHIQAYDFSAKLFIKYDLQSGDLIEKHNVPYELNFRPFRIAEINETRICVGGLGQGRVAFLNRRGDITMSEYDFPFSTEPYTGVIRGCKFQSRIFAAPTRPTFVILTLGSDCFEIYDEDDGKINRRYVNDFRHPPIVVNGVTDHKKSIAGFIRCYATDERIYFLYSDESYGDSLKKGFISDTVLVYKWSGEMEKTIKLPESVGAFCVNGNTLFGTRESLDHCEIVRFTI